MCVGDLVRRKETAVRQRKRFLRMDYMKEEGGVIPQQYRVFYKETHNRQEGTL